MSKTRIWMSACVGKRLCMSAKVCISRKTSSDICKGLQNVSIVCLCQRCLFLLDADQNKNLSEMTQGHFRQNRILPWCVSGLVTWVHRHVGTISECLLTSSIVRGHAQMSVSVVKCDWTLQTSQSNPDLTVFRPNQLLNWHMFFSLNKFEFQLTSEKVFDCQWMSCVIREKSSSVKKRPWCPQTREQILCLSAFLIEDGKIGFCWKWPRLSLRVCSLTLASSCQLGCQQLWLSKSALLTSLPKQSRCPWVERCSCADQTTTAQSWETGQSTCLKSRPSAKRIVAFVATLGSAWP